MKKPKWYDIIVCILMLPIILICSAVIFIKDKMKKKTESSSKEKFVCRGKVMTREEYLDHLPIYKYHYQETAEPLPDEEFYARILEVACIQYQSWDDWHGGTWGRELVIGEHPRETEEVLTFLRKHPIQELVCGNRHGEGCDLPSWELRFIFHDARLNRCIKGYGRTEDTERWLGEFVGSFPMATSKAEQWEQEHRMRECASVLEELEHFSKLQQ